VKPCQMAGGCYHEAVVTARIYRVGDRPLCQQHFDWLVSQMGEDCRALDVNAYVPAWRKRALQRDETARGLA